MHMQQSHGSSASAVAPGGAVSAAVGSGRRDQARTTPLRVDAQRNLEHVLRAVGRNRTRAADVLGIDRRTLYRMAERFGIKLDEEA